MDLVLDIGNSAAKGAVFTDGALAKAFRLDLAPASAPDGAWECALLDQLEAAPRRAALASVVPTATGRVRNALQNAYGLDPFCVSAAGEARLPFAPAYRTPATLGADRLAAAAAAWLRHGADAGRSVLALDAGTALTFEVVRAGPRGSGTYEGGAIAPGPALLQQALAGGTAQLPPVSLELPASPVGASTEEALQSGLLYGVLDSAGGMIQRLTRALGDGDAAPVVVSTGGWGAFLHEHLDHVTCHDPDLVLRGVHALLQMNAQP
jgi:type III pantothenate kinase